MAKGFTKLERALFGSPVDERHCPLVVYHREQRLGPRYSVRELKAVAGSLISLEYERLTERSVRLTSGTAYRMAPLGVGSVAS